MLFVFVFVTIGNKFDSGCKDAVSLIGTEASSEFSFPIAVVDISIEFEVEVVISTQYEESISSVLSDCGDWSIWFISLLLELILSLLSPSLSEVNDDYIKYIYINY